MEVEIGGTAYQAFQDIEGASIYLAGDFTHAAAWAAADADEQARLLVTATRVLQRQDWEEVPALDAAPQAVKDATAEFAAAILEGFDLGTPTAASLQVRRQKAGSVEVEYFRDIDNPAYRPPPLPQAVWDLILPLLKASSSEGGFITGSIASGTNGCSITEWPYGSYGGYVGFGSIARDCD